MKKLSLIAILCIIIFACESEIENYKTDHLSNAIVVYGEVNNFKGPYSVRINVISAYSPYDIREFIGKPVLKANVKIEDDLGNVIVLEEFGNGLYKTPVIFKGNTGQSYQLKITTSDGLEIESSIQKLKPTPKLEEFSYKFVDSEKVPDMRFDIKASIKDASETEDFYFVKKQEFIEFMTTCPIPPPPPAPTPQCYFKCWRAPLNTQPILLNDFLLNGKILPLSIKPINSLDWTDWIVQLDVHSVSKETYNYWQRQEDQRTIGGGLFDKIPAQIIGNLKCINKPSQDVLGAFVVSGLLKQRLIIKRYGAVGDDAFQKIESYANFNNLRNKDLPLYDCRQAGWIDYNIGFSVPEM